MPWDKPPSWPVESTDKFFQNPQDRHQKLGELFRAYLPEEYDDLDYDQLVDIAIDRKGSSAHAELTDAAQHFLSELKFRVRGEINRREERQSE